MKSINKALDVIEAIFKSEKEQISLGEIAELVGISKPTAVRIVSTLTKRNYLVQTEKRGKYSLSMKYLYFSCIIKQRIKIDRIARPYLLKLGDITGETVFLSVWDGRNARHVETIPTKHVVRPMDEEGIELPLHCTAVGKIFLAFNKNEIELNEYLKNNPLVPITPDTIVDIENFRNQLDTIIKNNISFNDAEYYPEVRSIAAPIPDAAGTVSAAVGVVAPSSRFTFEKMRSIKPSVQGCAMEIAYALGYHDSNPEIKMTLRKNEEKK